MDKFEWSNSGFQLLSEINIRIESYGGRVALLKIIEKENPVVSNTNGKWTPREVKILIDNIGRPNAVSLLTGRTYVAVKDKQARVLYNIRRKKFLFS